MNQYHFAIVLKCRVSSDNKMEFYNVISVQRVFQQKNAPQRPLVVTDTRHNPSMLSKSLLRFDFVLHCRFVKNSD